MHRWCSVPLRYSHAEILSIESHGTKGGKIIINMHWYFFIFSLIVSTVTFGFCYHTNIRICDINHWLECMQSQPLPLGFGRALFWCWMPLFVFFNSIRSALFWWCMLLSFVFFTSIRCVLLLCCMPLFAFFTSIKSYSIANWCYCFNTFSLEHLTATMTRWMSWCVTNHFKVVTQMRNTKQSFFSLLAER